MKMTNEHLFVSQFMIAGALLNSSQQLLEETCFNDDDTLDTLLDTINQGVELGLMRSKQLLSQAEERTCGRC